MTVLEGRLGPAERVFVTVLDWLRAPNFYSAFGLLLVTAVYALRPCSLCVNGRASQGAENHYSTRPLASSEIWCDPQRKSRFADQI